MISGSTRYARRLGFFGGLGAARNMPNPVLAPKAFVVPGGGMYRLPDRHPMPYEPSSPIYPDGENVLDSGSSRLRGLGVNVESNAFERATGLNFIPDDKGARISAKPTAILAALVGGAIGVKMADATKKGVLGGAIVGALLGALTINATAFAQSGGW